jgi:hypothetical protein
VRAIRPHGEALICPALDFVREHQQKCVFRVHLPLAGLAQPLRQHVYELPELELTEHSPQVR